MPYKAGMLGIAILVLGCLASPPADSGDTAIRDIEKNPAAYAGKEVKVSGLVDFSSSGCRVTDRFRPGDCPEREYPGQSVICKSYRIRFPCPSPLPTEPKIGEPVINTVVGIIGVNGDGKPYFSKVTKFSTTTLD